MKVPHQNLDKISGLPQDIIRNILALMPIRDAVRTSILSTNWRYSWTRIPKLVFDDHDMFEGSTSVNEEDENYNSKFVNAVFHVLFLHNGPILELCIDFEYNIDNEIDLIILHLSRSKIINKFFLNCPVDYKLPCSFFSLQGLEHLDLRFCKFELPSMFNGFSKLKSLTLYEITITAKMLQRFLTKCPLLEEFTLIESDGLLLNLGQQCTFVEFFKCLPTVQTVIISSCYIKQFAAGGMPRKLPTSLVHLRMLVLDEVCFQEQDGLSSALCVISSSPNLEKIQIEMTDKAEQTFITLLDPRDYLDLSLDHLKEFEIASFHNYDPEMEFVKLIMAKSPVLEKARIELNTSVSVDEENQMLQLPFPRASPTANFIIERPNSGLQYKFY